MIYLTEDNMKKFITAAIVPALLALAGCAADIGANQYDSSSVGSISQALPGTVISVRAIQVRDNDRSAGTALGGIAGGIAGSQIGRGSTAGILGAVGGTLIGGAAGNMAQKGLSSQQGYEYIIKLDNGRTITLTQGNDVLLVAGQRCMVLYGGGSARARVVPSNGY